MPTGDCNSVCTEWLLCGVFFVVVFVFVVVVVLHAFFSFI